MKVVVCGEVYSGNLGDGVIAETLAYLIGCVAPEVEVCPLDLSGRTGLAKGSKQKVGRLRRVNRALVGTSGSYRRLAYQLAWLRTGNTIARDRWLPALAGADLLVIGGGNLLIDNDLNFPRKLRHLAGLAREHKVPVAVLACGVGRHISATGRRFLKEALAGALWLGVRDEQSRDNLAAILGCAANQIVVAPDPGIAAAAAFGVQRQPQAGCLGMGITAPQVLRRHTRGAAPDAQQWLDYWRDVCLAWRRQGGQVVLFCNGAPEDHEFAREVADTIAAAGMTPPAVLRRPRRPLDLVRDIAGLEVVVAHRLHANVVAYALGVPAVGLAWDEKLRSFGQITGRADFVLDDRAAISVDMVVSRLTAALDRGVDRREVTAKIELMNEAIVNMFAIVRAAGAAQNNSYRGQNS